MRAMDWMDVRSLVDPLRSTPESGYESDPTLLDALNEPQREACRHVTGPLLILAGPGSGKTRVITNRIVHLITEGGVRPDEILAITFTNKAANEMRHRVERLLPGVKGLWVSTFHAMCARILRREIEVLDGYTRDFSIYDTSDRNSLLKKVIKDVGLDLTKFRPGMVGGWISDRKNKGFQDERELIDPAESLGFDDEMLVRVQKKYEEATRTANALDFDDLLIKTLEVFDKHPGVRDAYARRFRQVMVDEYQDTNRVQYLLTRHLASGHGNLAVVGDPDQSIYAWRGADIRNILAFEEDFGAPKVIRLEQNYRSKGNILKAASAVIANNSARKAKDLWTDLGDGERVVVIECGDENDEAREIAYQIQGWKSGGGRFSDVAVFYRANFMQRALESALHLAKVPYQVVGGVEFYARREIRDLIGYLKLTMNPSDDVAFRRIVNVPARGVGETSLGRLSAWAGGQGVSMLEACRSSDALAEIRGRAKKGLALFGELMERLAPVRDVDAAVAMDLVLEEIERDRWFGEMDDGSGVADREANVDELRSHAAEFDRMNPEGKLRGFLQDIALVSEIDGLDEEVDKAALMTLHAAKGLEFKLVLIAGVEEELLPHARSLAESGDMDGALEEERRLFYVGMTRAEDRLVITHAGTRHFFGDQRWARPSRFLDEIPPELIEGQEADGDEEDVLGVYEPSENALALVVGDRVEHDHFGPGRVEQLQGSGVNARAVVRFAHHGTKQLLLQYANLRRIGAEE
jgi:DNA helicase-2/ATP-dependent DNA helicase PcrA